MLKSPSGGAVSRALVDILEANGLLYLPGERPALMIGNLVDRHQTGFLLLQAGQWMCVFSLATMAMGAAPAFGSGADDAARARQPAQRRGDGAGRNGGLRDPLRQQHARVVRCRWHIDDDARLRRADNLQQCLLGESAEVSGVVDSIDGAAELGLTPHLIDALDFAELFPRRGHQLLLLSLHDLRAERGDGAVARIEIQFIQPGRRDAGGAGVMSPCAALPASSRRSAARAAGLRPPQRSPAPAHRESF